MKQSARQRLGQLPAVKKTACMIRGCENNARWRVAKFPDVDFCDQHYIRCSGVLSGLQKAVPI